MFLSSKLVLLAAIGVCGCSSVNAFVGTSLPGLVQPVLRTNGMCGKTQAKLALRRLAMQSQPSQQEEVVQQADFEVPPPPPSKAPTAPPSAIPETNWFERTTAQDRSLRVGGDPLAPYKNPVPRELTGANARIEEEGREWYAGQESRKSMFGRTLNPLTGKLEKKDDSAKTLNIFEDPIFYIILIVVAPIFIMIGGAYACIVPALSMAFGAQCEF